MTAPIHEQLRDRRVQLGWSVFRLSQTIGIHHTQVKRWENGETSPGLDNAIAWAKGLGFDLTLAAIPGLELEKAERPVRAAPPLLSDERGRLRWLRILAGLTQADVAEAVGVSADAVKQWENGRCGVAPKRLEAWRAAVGDVQARVDEAVSA